MKVSELAELIASCDPDTEVLVLYPDGGKPPDYYRIPLKRAPMLQQGSNSIVLAPDFDVWNQIQIDMRAAQDL
jgi:hypothetical protein